MGAQPSQGEGEGRDMKEMLADCMMAGEKEGKPRVQSEQRTLIGEMGSL